VSSSRCNNSLLRVGDNHALFPQIILKTEDDEEKSVASVSAVLFFVLALQTGLTGMEGEKRFQQICKNLCLLLTAVLHFIHSMVQPVLMSLSASRSSNRASHVRALAICLFLLVSPSILVFILWTHFTLGTWLLAVTAFCVEVWKMGIKIRTS
jgi:E3 ubiquitin-protein ligase RNF139